MRRLDMKMVVILLAVLIIGGCFLASAPPVSPDYAIERERMILAKEHSLELSEITATRMNETLPPDMIAMMFDWWSGGQRVYFIFDDGQWLPRRG
jgi:hypothetical protein